MRNFLCPRVIRVRVSEGYVSAVLRLRTKNPGENTAYSIVEKESTSCARYDTFLRLRAKTAQIRSFV